MATKNNFWYVHDVHRDSPHSTPPPGHFERKPIYLHSNPFILWFRTTAVCIWRIWHLHNYTCCR